MMKRYKFYAIFATLLGAQLSLSTPTQAAGDKILVELFTSQGCNSCPPADAMLGEIADEPGVLALSMHVDYWDYLGWKDTFAQPEFTRRQTDYRDAWGDRVVYTPQLVVNGDMRLVGSDREGVRDALVKARGHAGAVELYLENSGDGVTARLVPSGAVSNATLWYATYMPHATVEIRRGENAGRDITYHNVVTSLNRLGPWNGTAETEVVLPSPANGEAIALWLQDGEGGRVLAAETYMPGS